MSFGKRCYQNLIIRSSLYATDLLLFSVSHACQHTLFPGSSLTKALVYAILVLSCTIPSIVYIGTIEQDRIHFSSQRSEINRILSPLVDRNNPSLHSSKVLFISYKFVKGFLAITVLLLVFSSWNFHDVCQRFLYKPETTFELNPTKNDKFPHRPPF